MNSAVVLALAALQQARALLTESAREGNHVPHDASRHQQPDLHYLPLAFAGRLLTSSS